MEGLLTPRLNRARIRLAPRNVRAALTPAIPAVMNVTTDRAQYHGLDASHSEMMRWHEDLLRMRR